MPFQIIRNDITKVKADAIVNTANPKPRIGQGTDSAIYAAAGEKELLAAREKIGNISPGQAAWTDAYALNAKYIIHTVGPVWIDGSHDEREVLRFCYENSLKLAEKLECTSIAFPLIASGSYGFPKSEALHIALSEIERFLLSHEMLVTIVVFDRTAVELSESLVSSIEHFIDDHTAERLHAEEHSKDFSTDELSRRRRINEAGRTGFAFNETPPLYKKEAEAHYKKSNLSVKPAVTMTTEMQGKSLDEILGETGESFQQRLFKLIDASGLDDVAVYKKANIDRKVFSRIRCKPDYKPTKKTAVAFSIALKLDMETMTDLLSRAGIAFSPSNTFDLIITYCVTNKIYDIYEVNAILFRYKQPPLGAVSPE